MRTVHDGIPELARLSRLRTSRSGRSPDWLKMKNANAPAVKREEEEEWDKKKLLAILSLPKTLSVFQHRIARLQKIVDDPGRTGPSCMSPAPQLKTAGARPLRSNEPCTPCNHATYIATALSRLRKKSAELACAEFGCFVHRRGSRPSTCDGKVADKPGLFAAR
jgi:hypothetical protein